MRRRTVLTSNEIPGLSQVRKAQSAPSLNTRKARANQTLDIAVSNRMLSARRGAISLSRAARPGRGA
ncbi:MAG: hypothetical protein U0990_03590 [Candidatus Nanopelagicales bacterium]|nr:hypothetical protein [Candidatus Nanopelagicales bacterium]MDZ4249157.1 hypothetical protein [Candidatus Nanopelagicales bacterium]MDZ7577389.1 hypothetical protein [Candidatus Nanopelagicales bacterium]